MLKPWILWLVTATAFAMAGMAEPDLPDSAYGEFRGGFQHIGRLLGRQITSSTSSSANSFPATDGSSSDGTAIDGTTTLPIVNMTGSCSGSTTYYGQKPQTVYATITEGYEVTMARNATFTAQETLYTPPSACTFTVLPPNSTLSPPQPGAPGPLTRPTPPFLNQTVTPSNSRAGSEQSSKPLPNYSTPPGNQPPPPASSSIQNGGFSTPPAAVVTVTVTKKTPVPVTPTKTMPGAHFPTNPPDSSLTINAPPTPPPSVSSSPDNATPGNVPSNQNTTPNPAGPSNSPNSNTNPQGTNNGPSNNGGSSGLGSIINSIINSPFVPAPTSFGTAAPSATLIHGVPVQVGSSSVFLGGQTVALPSASQQTTVIVAGETFTVRPTEIVAGSETVTFDRQQTAGQAPQSLAVVPLATSTVTYNGVVITIGPSQAILSSTTYQIGPNAPSTTIFINGGNDGSKQSIIFDSDGVVFPSTTYNPALTVANAFVVTTLGPHLTVSLDMTEAVLSGTVYRIGPGATVTTSIVDGTTVIFGPSGVIVPGLATLGPTSVSITSTVSATGIMSSTASTKATGSASPSQTAANANGASCQRLDSSLNSGAGGLAALLFLLFEAFI